MYKFVALIGVLIVGAAAINVKDHSNYFEISKNIEIYTNLYKEINTYYVDDLDPAKLMKTGIDAMLESLDPFTNYISETDIEGFRYITEGKYNGIGAQIEEVNGRLVVTEVYDESPAFKAGIIVGDELRKVDGRETQGRSFEEVDALLKGYPGSKVDLELKRPGEKKNVTTTLTRDEVSISNVPFNGMVSDDIGYVALTTFTRNAGLNVAKAVRKLKEENPEMKGIIFDLRGNGGGLLTEAVNVSNVFVDKGEPIVSTRGKVKDWDRPFKTLNNPVDTEIPLVVLVNKNSASASEIVSGSIQDLDRGVLMGQRTYGKGLVQNTRDIGYNAKVKLTTSKYYIPSGRCIQSVKYEDGEPVDIPLEERTPFKTRNGRTVRDGGGVRPDVIIDLGDESSIVEQLQDEFLLFDYVTQYRLKNDSIAQPETFKFTDWDGFMAFLNERNFAFATESDELLEKLEAQAAEDGYAVTAEIQTLKKRLLEQKKTELQENKDRLIGIIEKEIANRYYGENGRVKMGLRNDLEIKEAIKLLGDSARYAEILMK